MSQELLERESLLWIEDVRLEGFVLEYQGSHPNIAWPSWVMAISHHWQSALFFDKLETLAACLSRVESSDIGT